MSNKKRRGATLVPLIAHDETFPGSEYSDDEIEFMRAAERYKREAGVRFPSSVELLRVAMELGWRKSSGTGPGATSSTGPAKTRKPIEGYHRKRPKTKPRET